jgi:hypothetical protein
MLSFLFWSRRSLPGKSDKITAGTLGEAADRDECEVLIEEEMQYQRLRGHIRVTSEAVELCKDCEREGHRFSSKGYCVWPPAEVHMATCWELRDWPDHESSEIALSGYSAFY